MPLPGWECVWGRKDRRLGQGQLPAPAARWVIFGLGHQSPNTFLKIMPPRDHWVAPDERKEGLMGIHELSIRSRIPSRLVPPPTLQLFWTASSDEACIDKKDGRVRFPICRRRRVQRISFCIFKAGWERSKARKLGLSSFVFPRRER